MCARVCTKDGKVSLVMGMINTLKDGNAVPESTYVRLQSASALSDGESGEEEAPESDKEGEDAEQDEAEEGEAGEGPGEEEEGDEGNEGPEVEASGTECEKGKENSRKDRKISMPPPPPPRAKASRSKKGDGEAAFIFPTIRPNPHAAGSGRTPEEVELAQTMYHIERLEKKMGVLPDYIICICGWVTCVHECVYCIAGNLVMAQGAAREISSRGPPQRAPLVFTLV